MSIASQSCMPYLSPRRGISLLEVLISIGILAIGLTAVLSLIPAGRSQMKKAAVDDRAAALIPNAYATMQNLGLFRKGALSWEDLVATGVSYEKPLSPVYRDVQGVDVFAGSRTGELESASDDGWTVTSTDSAVITGWHQRTSPPPKLQGTIPSGDGVTVNVSTLVSGTIAADAPQDDAVANANGAWTLPLSGRFFPAPDMEIETSGPKVGQPKDSPTPFVDYTFEARYVDPVSGAYQPATVTPATYRQYGQLRSTDHRTGRAKLTYVQRIDPRMNESFDEAVSVPVPRLQNATSQKRGAIARSVSINVFGSLWRMQLGTREGSYSRDYGFPNTYPQGDGTLIGRRFKADDIVFNVEDTWLDQNGNSIDPNDTESLRRAVVISEDRDWYFFDAEAGQIITLEWQDDDGVLDNSAPLGAGAFPLYFKTLTNQLMPFSSSGNTRRYSVPQDGRVYTRAQLAPVVGVSLYDNSRAPDLQNTFGPPGQPLKDAYGNFARRNPTYNLSIKVERSERVVVIDPLMATKLDKIIALRGNNAIFDPYVLRRARFADFQQTFAGGGTPRAFVIPRLNWQVLSDGSVDTALAIAERLFRDEDNMAVELADNEDDAPSPLFDLTAAKQTAPQRPLRRQATGKMSWLLMVQPEDPGPVAMNWEPGKYFDVSIVIFEDRTLPPADVNAALDGEYAFKAGWNDADGLVRVTVPFAPDLNNDGQADYTLVGDDVRRLFKTGAWVLLAPQIAYNASPIDNQQRLDWIRIRTAEFENTGNGMEARLLLDSEPTDNVLMRSLGTGPTFPLVVMAYDGVVAVVNKSIRLEP
jgi:type II secretory pathway pseudopilin PulG